MTDQSYKTPTTSTRLAPAEAGRAIAAVPGKQTLVEAVVQRKPGAGAAEPGDEQASGSVRTAAAQGISGGAQELPFASTIQRLFGRHDVSGVQAHTDATAAEGAKAIGATAYATGNHVAFGATPDLHTAAHEAAHVVQQRAGVQLKGGVGEASDPH